MSISPDNGARNAAPDQGITVRVANGKIGHVTVTAHGDPVTGVLTHGGTVWRSQWALNVAQAVHGDRHRHQQRGQDGDRYQLVPHADPVADVPDQILEGHHQTYGVGMPILLQFDHPIAKRFRGGDRALAADHHVQAGRRRLVLG